MLIRMSWIACLATMLIFCVMFIIQHTAEASDLQTLAKSSLRKITNDGQLYQESEPILVNSEASLSDDYEDDNEEEEEENELNETNILRDELLLEKKMNVFRSIRRSIRRAVRRARSTVRNAFKKPDYKKAYETIKNEASKGDVDVIALMLAWNAYHEGSDIGLPRYFKQLARYQKNHKSVTIYVSSYRRTIAVAYRGTQFSKFKDAMTNVKQKRVKRRWGGISFRVHKGFEQEHDFKISAYYPKIENYLKKGYSLLLTGHSQGGALAELNALHLVLLNKIRPNTVITFGAPRIGDHQYAKAVRSKLKVTRYVNRFKSHFTKKWTSELVTQLPGKKNFEHASRPTYVTCKEKMMQSLNCHKMLNYAYGLAHA